MSTRREELHSLEQGAAATVRALTAAFKAGQEQTDPLEYIEVLRDPGAITARFDELQSSIKREILIFTKPPYAKPPQENVEGLAVVRNHEARSIYEFSVFDDAAVAEGVRHGGVIEDRKLVDAARLMVANDREALDVLLWRLRVGRLGKDQDLSFDRRLELIKAGGDRARVAEYLDVLERVGLLLSGLKRRRERAHGCRRPLFQAMQLLATRRHQQLDGEFRFGGGLRHA